MPRIPTAGTTTGQVPFSTNSPFRTVALANSAAGVINTAAQGSLGLQAELEDEKNRHDVSMRLSDLTRDINNLALEAEADPDYEGKTDRFFEGATEALQLAVGHARNKKVAGVISARGEMLLESTRVSVAKSERKQFVEEGRSGVVNLVNDSADQFAIAKNDLAREIITENVIGSVDESKLFSPEEKRVLKEEYHKRSDFRLVETQLEKADEAETDIERLARIDAALALVESGELEHIDRGDLKKMATAIESERSGVVGEIYKGHTRAVRQDIELASTPGDFASASARIDTLFDAGAISEAKATELDLAILSRGNRLIAADSGAAMIERSLQNGIPIDPSEGKAISAWYEERFLPSMEGADDGKFREELVDVVRSIGVIPQPFMDRMNAVANNGSESDIARMAQLFVGFRDVSPQAVARVPDQTSVLLENVAESMVMNVPIGEAIQREREKAKLDPSVIKGRNDGYRWEQSQMSDGTWLENSADDFNVNRPFFPGFNFFDLSSDDMDEGLKGMFASEVQRQYSLDPDIEKSRERALRRLKVVAGPTAVGGRERFMWLSPEVMYPEFLGDSEAITKNVVDDLMAAKGDFPQIEELSSEYISTHLILAPDAQSIREVDPERGRLKPSYNIFIEEGEGDEFSGLITNEDGTPVRFTPELKGFVPSRAAVEEEVAEATSALSVSAVDRAKMRRDSRNRVQPPPPEAISKLERLAKQGFEFESTTLEARLPHHARRSGGLTP